MLRVRIGFWAVMLVLVIASSPVSPAHAGPRVFGVGDLGGQLAPLLPTLVVNGPASDREVEALASDLRSKAEVVYFVDTPTETVSLAVSPGAGLVGVERTSDVSRIISYAAFGPEKTAIVGALVVHGPSTLAEALDWLTATINSDYMVPDSGIGQMSDAGPATTASALANYVPLADGPSSGPLSTTVTPSYVYVGTSGNIIDAYTYWADYDHNGSYEIHWYGKVETWFTANMLWNDGSDYDDNWMAKWYQRITPGYAIESGNGWITKELLTNYRKVGDRFVGTTGPVDTSGNPSGATVVVGYIPPYLKIWYYNHTSAIDNQSSYGTHAQWLHSHNSSNAYTQRVHSPGLNETVVQNATFAVTRTGNVVWVQGILPQELPISLSVASFTMRKPGY